MLLRFQLFEDFPVVFLLLISSLSLWLESLSLLCLVGYGYHGKLLCAFERMALIVVVVGSFCVLGYCLVVLLLIVQY